MAPLARADRTSLCAMLLGGDRRSTGRADELARAISRDPALFAQTLALVTDDDPLVRMRAADAAEKASRSRPDLLDSHTAVLLGPISGVEQQEVQWHLLQMLPRMKLAPGDRAIAFEFAAQLVLASTSRIVAADALSALFALSDNWPLLRERATAYAREALNSSSPAIRARARKLLRQPFRGRL